MTGAGGFIGTHVAAALRDAEWQVVGFGYRQSMIAQSLGLATPDHFEIGAVTSEGLARTASEIGWPEIVIHAAGGATVTASLSAPEIDLARNVGSVREVLAFLRQRPGKSRLVFLSSAAVYGDADKSRISEATRTSPLSPYGKHKLAAEDLVREAGAKGLIEASVVRFFSVYGPGNRKQLPWEIACRLTGEHRLQLYGTGAETRDFLYIDDAVALIGLVAGLARERLPPVVNGGSGIATTVRKLAEVLSRAMGIGAEITFNANARTGDPVRLVSDPTLARSLGFSTKTDLSTGLAAFATWAHRELCGDVRGA